MTLAAPVEPPVRVTMMLAVPPPWATLTVAVEMLSEPVDPDGGGAESLLPPPQAVRHRADSVRLILAMRPKLTMLAASLALVPIAAQMSWLTDNA